MLLCSSSYYYHVYLDFVFGSILSPSDFPRSQWWWLDPESVQDSYSHQRTWPDRKTTHTNFKPNQTRASATFTYGSNSMNMHIEQGGVKDYSDIYIDTGLCKGLGTGMYRFLFITQYHQKGVWSQIHSTEWQRAQTHNQSHKEKIEQWVLQQMVWSPQSPVLNMDSFWD